MHSEDFALIENFKSLMRQAMIYAQYSHESIFDGGFASSNFM